MDKIVAEDLARHGPIVVTLFRALYPEGLTLEELRNEAERHGFLRMVLRKGAGYGVRRVF